MPKWIYTQPILPRCHSPHFLSPNLFLFSLRSPSVQNLQAEALIQIPKAIQIPFTNSKRKQTKQSTISTPAKRTKAKPKRHHNTFHPTSTTRKTHLLHASQLSPNHRQNPWDRQTQVRFLSNAKEFTAKRRSVSDKTSKSFLPNAKTFPPPVTSPHSCFPKAHIKIPLNRFQNLLNTPNLCVNNPIQKTSEKGLPCILPSERINPSRQKDRNPARILHKRHHSFPEKEKRTKKKNRKKSIEKRIFTIHITINS